MAKKNKVEIDVVVDDKGSTKKVGVQAKKAAKGLDNVDASSRNAQKGIKGVAQTASAGSKNFAGMSRGMGGLVGAYASFAAQMFALTAAFGFFKRAGDLSVMQQGQVAYASATGIAMRSLAKNINDATGSQITFRDASQAAAIGNAAGLSADQMVRLGSAAKDASAVLGRDVTDAFNRLIRGVTKAEPELLDELGIILRLDTASENYARSLGKATNDLTQFEKSQAVANEVLSQAETKYSAILAVTGGGAVNQFAKLGKSMDDVVMTIQNAVLPAANLLAKVLGDTPILAAAGFALLAAGPMKAMGFSIKESAATSAKAAVQAKADYAQRKMDILETTKAINLEKAAIQQKAQASLKSEGYTGKSKVLKNVATTGIITPQARASIRKGLQAVNLDVKESTVIQKGMFKGLTVGVVKEYEAMVVRLDGLEKAKAAGTVTNVQKMKLAWGALATGIKSATAAVAGFGAMMLRVFGWVSLAITVLLVFKEMFSMDKEVTAASAALEKQRDKVKDLIKEYEHFIEVQRIMRQEGTGSQGIQSSAAVGGLIGSLNTPGTMQLLEDYVNYQDKAAASGYDVALSQLEIAKATGASADVLKYYENRVSATSGRVGELLRKLVGSSLDDEGAITDAELNAKKFMDTQIKAIDDIIAEYGGNKAFENFRNLLVGGKGTTEQIQAAKDAVASITATYKGYTKTVQEAADASASFNNSLAPSNAAENAILKQQKIIAEAQKLRENYKPSTAEQQAAAAGMLVSNPMMDKSRKDEAAAELEIKRLMRINEAQAKRKRLLNAATLEVKKAAQIEHPLYRARLTSVAQVTVATQKRLQVEDEISVLQNEVIGTGKKGTLQQERMLANLRSKLALTVVDEESAKRKLELNTEVFALEVQIYNLKTNQKLVQSAKQLLDFDKQALDIASRKQKIEEAESKRKIEKAISAQEGPGGLLQYEPQIRAELEAQAAKDQLAAKTLQIEAEFDLKRQMQKADNDLQMFKYQLLLMEMEKLKIERKNLATGFRLAAAKEKDPAVRQGLLDQANEISSVMFGDTVMTGIISSIQKIITGLPERGKALIELLDAEEVEALKQAGFEVDNLASKAADLQPMEVLLKDLGSSVHDNMSSAFTAIVTGAKSAKDAFADMAVGILKDLAAMIVKMAILNMFKGSAFGNFIGLGARSGGVFDQGKKMSGYATGGIAKGSTSGYPVMMHGTEAVVPLPNGKSIPVQMSGNGGGSTNNIVVNISTEGQSSKQGSSGPDMDKLGGAVAAAVQVELQNQKRSGGILNPYGAA
jgi:hypothetical protein